jgi:hypothetical protein
MGVPLDCGTRVGKANAVDDSRALATGLSFRPLVGTIRDTYEWDISRTSREEGLTREGETRLLAATR